MLKNESSAHGKNFAIESSKSGLGADMASSVEGTVFVAVVHPIVTVKEIGVIAKWAYFNKSCSTIGIESY